MAINYLRMRATATRLLTENGAQYTLTRGGTVQRDENGREVKTPAVSSTVTGVITAYQPREIDNSLVLTGDIKLTATFETEIRSGDLIAIDGRTYRVVQPNPVIPGKVIISYKVQLRM
ncbi:hypothetical protein [Buttiauxella gaviniae]|uniref:hypothetical protein n=1 Tax=Buttiauxella gaviniae TaxID=82990 RepID=UPI003C774A14